MIRDWLAGAAEVLLSGLLLILIALAVLAAIYVVFDEVRDRRREREARRHIRETTDRETARWLRALLPEQREGE